LIVPPKAIEPPVLALVSTVNKAVLFRVMGTVPATVKELDWMLVTPVPTEKPPLPEPIVNAPRREVAPTLPERETVPVLFAVNMRACAPTLAPLIVPPKAIEPPVLALVSIVTGAVLLSVVGTVPATVKELDWMLVTPVPTEKPPLPEPIVKAPKRVVAPTFAERETVPVLLAVNVRAWAPTLAPLIVPPKAIEPPVLALVSTVNKAVLLSVVGTTPATVKELD
jgi:hypothetical protein